MKCCLEKKDQTMKKKKKNDKSDYFASVSSLNGALNGSPGPYNLDLNPKTFKVGDYGAPGSTWVSNGFNKALKFTIIMQNLLAPYMTMQRPQENIHKTLWMKNKNL